MLMDKKGLYIKFQYAILNPVGAGNKILDKKYLRGIGKNYLFFFNKTNGIFIIIKFW